MGEDKLVIMLGGLHIELAVLKQSDLGSQEVDGPKWSHKLG